MSASGDPAPRPRDEPWIFRTYAGFGTPALTNERFKRNLAKGQTGLSVAFDLPTQCGYDADDELSIGEVGKVGVPVGHLGDLRAVFDGLPLDRMNTSMTINATALWVLALYAAVADEQRATRASLSGTTQNDVLKEYLSRGTYAFPPVPSLRLTADLITWTAGEIPRWNPINVCSYHLQEAGAGPALEVGFALANAACVLDAVRATGRIGDEEFPAVVGRVSFFVNAGIRFVEELAKMRAFVSLWDRLARERYGVRDAKLRRFRYGVQVNSLGLTPQQPENNAYRILLEMLAVTLSRDARARAVQLPAWNEALGLPRAWDQQWSLRAQQILAEETDLLEHGDLFEGSPVMADLQELIETEAWAEFQRVQDMGGSVEALGYMKERLVAALAERLRRIERGEQPVIGVNRYVESESSPLAPAVGEGLAAVERIEHQVEEDQRGALAHWRAARDGAAVRHALDVLRETAEKDQNLMEATLGAARAGVTTGEWAGALRDVFGSYRAPTGVGAVVTSGGGDEEATARARWAVADAAARRGIPKVRLLVAKPGLDGHSNAAEQVALRARDCGFEVIYQGIRLTPREIARAAADEDVHAIGLSILSGSHMALVPAVLRCLADEGFDARRVPVVVGGVVPDDEAEALREMGVAAVFRPGESGLTESLARIAGLV
jgi:(2R)-ethylmalonyl-CoA mutase